MKRIPKRLISKFLENDISSEEVQELKIWMKQPENERLLKKEIQLYHIINEHFKTFDAEAAYAKNSSKLKSKRVIHLKSRAILRYAVAASVVLAIGLTFFFNNGILDKDKPTQTANTINIGTDKALLTLEDGSVIILDQEQKYNNDNLISDGTSVAYKTQHETSKTIRYNTLTIPRGGQYHVTLSDGTEVWLNSESQLKYPVSFQPNETRTVELLYGEAYFDVSSSSNHNGAKFMVQHHLQDIEVVGTQFNVKAYNDEMQVLTTLVEGIVNVNGYDKTLVLNPEKQTVLDKSNATITVQDADILSETSWIKGDFFFQRKPLQDIVKVLSRWYDVDIIIENDNLKTIEFTGELSKYQNIEDILNLIKDTNIISNYTVDKDKIVIR